MKHYRARSQRLEAQLAFVTSPRKSRPYLATDEGLSIFCCELAFVCERCDLLLDLTTLFERPFEEEKLNIVTKPRGEYFLTKIESRAPVGRERLKRGTQVCGNECISWRRLHRRLTLQHARCMDVVERPLAVAPKTLLRSSRQHRCCLSNGLTEEA